LGFTNPVKGGYNSVVFQKKSMASTWLIHDKDGGLLGESTALSAKVAFVLYLSGRGKSVNLNDVKSETLPDGRVRVSVGRKVHFLKKEDR
jgi:hypothetical protein